MATKVPSTLKSIANYVKIANENSSRDPIVYYWCLFYAVNQALHIDKNSPEARQFITGLLGTLEAIKKQLQGNEAITSEVVAQAHLENFAWKLFKYADEKEKVGNVDKGVVHAFFTSGFVFDVLSTFGEVCGEESFSNLFYANKHENNTSCRSTKASPTRKSMPSGSACRLASVWPRVQPYVSSSQQKNQQEEDDELLRQLTSFGTPGQPQPQQPPPAYGSNPFEHNYNQTPVVPGHLQPPGGNNYGFNDANAYRPPVPPSAPQNYIPAASTVPIAASPTPSTVSAPAAPGAVKQPTLQEFTEAKKFIKYALSAIDFEDTKAVVDNLQKALRLME